jgi:tetratricopeptide (TPR) repeat protein
MVSTEPAAGHIMVFLAALSAAKTSGNKSAKAAVHYSWANLWREIGQYALAIQHLNAARRLLPTYEKTVYFLKELGNALYLDQKYKCSSHVYGLAVGIGADRVVYERLGTAQMFSGEIASAMSNFLKSKEALEHDGGVNPELDVKIWLCERLIRRFGTEQVPARSQAAGLKWDDLERISLEHAIQNRSEVTKIDTFNLRANFNDGIEKLKSKDYEASLEGFLICALRSPSYVQAWANGLLSTLPIGNHSLMADMMIAALQLGGRQAYESFRELLVDYSPEATGGLDEMFRDLWQQIQSRRKFSYTLRLAPH